MTSNCLFACKIYFFWQCARLMWSRDWPRPKLKEIWSFKLQDFNVLENTCFIFQNLNFTGAYVSLNGDSKNFLFFCHYFHFMSSPSPSPIDIRCNWNKYDRLSYKTLTYSKIFALSFKTLTLPGHMWLRGILKMFYSFVIISILCLVPVPLRLIYVAIETK